MPDETPAIDHAVGLPDPKRFGRADSLPLGRLLEWVTQEHDARRAGKHLDVRMGPHRGDAPTLLSWATRKDLPQPGDRPIALFQQPLHRGTYADFQGELAFGYGAGTVKTRDRGKLIVTDANSRKINFVLAHKKHPEYFTLVRTGMPPRAGTDRTRKTQGGSWLLINTTPRDMQKYLGMPDVKKPRYTKVDAKYVDKLFDPKYSVQEKIDGAHILYKLLGDRVEAISHRVSAEGRPIVHTHRLFGAGGLRTKIPEELQGTVLRGEAWGERAGKAVPPQELGGILNASIVNSLRKQQEGGVTMRNTLFDVVREGRTPLAGLTPQERRQKLVSILARLPKGRFSLPETASSAEDAARLWTDIVEGRNPRTTEGIVGWPVDPTKPPVKVKRMPESDVWIKDVFPGEGKLSGRAAGGFEYSTTPDGEAVGRVGTGFDDATRADMWENPDMWTGRLARIKSQERFPGGAHRAPVFLARHEDYPSKSASLVTLVKQALVPVDVGLPKPDALPDLLGEALVYASRKLPVLVPPETPDKAPPMARVHAAARSGMVDPTHLDNLLQASATEATADAVRSGRIRPENADKTVQRTLARLRKHQQSLADEAYTGLEAHRVQAPVKPVELATATGMGVGIPWALSRLASLFSGAAPLTVGQSARFFMGPAALIPGAIFNSLELASAPSTDPARLRGERSYLSSVGHALDAKADVMQEKGKEVEKTYGTLGSVPVRVLHGLLNPVTSAYYGARSLGRAIGLVSPEAPPP